MENAFSVAIQPVDEAEQEQKEEWNVNEYATFQSRDDLLAKLESPTLSVDDKYLWFKPELWCQKSFDFLRFHRQDGQLCMLAVNASHAKKHAVLLSVLSDLGQFLAKEDCPVASILFRFVVPSGEAFAVGSVTGRLDDWQWPPTKNLMLKGGHISVADLSCTS
jgi:hypothetical protein